VNRVSETFDPARWRDVPGFEHLTDITYHRGVDRGGPGDPQDLPWVRVAFNRPEVRNAFRPHTVDELLAVLNHVKLDPTLAVVLLTGNGPSPKDGGWAFSSGGDQRVRGPHGYEDDATGPTSSAGRAGTGRLHILEVQQLIRSLPKVVIAVVDGWAAGGGHSLGVVCDLTLACREHGRFKQTDADVASFDAGYGAALLARQVGQKRAREIFFLAETYTAEQAVAWGAANEAVSHETLEARAIEVAGLIAGKSPQAIRLLKYAFNMVDDGFAGQMLFAGEATRLAYGTEEAREGRDAFLERRPPRWDRFRSTIQ
jgi:naphthoate synthase